jgi:hypothetical protein
LITFSRARIDEAVVQETVRPAKKRRLRTPGAKWIPPTIAVTLAGVSSYGALAMIAPKIRLQSAQEELRLYESQTAAEAQSAGQTEQSLAKLQAAIKEEIAAVQRLSQLSPETPSASGSTPSSSSGGGAGVPTLSIPTISAPPATHSTTGASATAG